MRRVKQAYGYELNVKCAGCDKSLRIITFDKSNTEYFCQRCNTFDLGSVDDD